MSQKNEILRLEPIGILKTCQDYKYQLPPQPNGSPEIQGVVELETKKNFDVCLRDLDGFSHIWLIWWFHKNQNWRPTTLPPRGRTGRKGTFSTRSPYRPNPIAMSCVELLGIEGHELFIGAHDLLMETPILDIKPYMPKFDSFPDAKAGWFDQMEYDLNESQPYSVIFEQAAEQSLKSILADGLREQIQRILTSDPLPHRTRRIIAIDDHFRLSCGDWRVAFIINGQTVTVRSVNHR